MCLIAVALGVRPDLPLVMAANRDEFYERETAVAAFWSDEPQLLAGRDLQAGGTWLGVTRSGRLAAVTNFREGFRRQSGARSRGELVRGWLEGDEQPERHFDRLQQIGGEFQGYSLLFGNLRELWLHSNRGGPAGPLAPGIHGLSNHLLGTAWPKLERARRGMEAALDEPAERIVEALMQMLADRSQPDDGDLPDTGVGIEWERLLSPVFVESERYGTRSSTVVLARRDGGVEFVERALRGDRSGWDTRRYEFRAG